MKRARHNYYFILLDRSLGVHNVFYTTYLLNFANAGLDSLGVSRSVPLNPVSRPQALSILNRDIQKVRGANAAWNGIRAFRPLTQKNLRLGLQTPYPSFY